MDSQTIFLLLSLLALALGPVVYQMARLAGRLMCALDGFLYVAIGGLVFLHILPESVALAGWVAILGTAAGIWLPTLIEKRLQGLAHQAHTVSLVFGLVAIALHAFADGLAISTGFDHAGSHGGHGFLPVAVVLHRLPVGLTVWFLLRPAFGLRLATAALILIGMATSAGYVAGLPVLAALESRAWGLFQALVAGSLLHVVLHRSYPLAATSADRDSRSSAFGALAGIGLLWSMTGQVAAPIAAGAGVFHVLALAAAPALLLAYVGTGLAWALVPRGTVTWMRRGSSVRQAARGMALRLPLPICSCGVLPMYRALAVAGVPLSAAISALIVAPALSLDALLISLPLLGGELAAGRIAAAVVIALLTGWVVGRQAPLRPVSPAAAAPCPAPRLPPQARLRGGLQVGLSEVVDTTAPWMLFGLALAAAAGALSGDGLAGLLPAGFEVSALALAGMPIYLCASGATPLAAVLIAQGVSPGAALAFLVTGPVTSLTTIGMLGRLHGRRVALLFALAVPLLAIVLGHAANDMLDSRPGATPWLTQIDPESRWRSLCLLLVAALFAASLLRRGPRRFVGELFDADAAVAPVEAHGHDHDSDNPGADDDAGGCAGHGCAVRWTLRTPTGQERLR